MGRVVVDGTNQILGRLASLVAKKLLSGEQVVVVNAEKIVLSGDPKMVIESYKKLFQVSTLRNPERTGIRRPRTPIRLFKAAVKGMLPKNKPRGREALKRLRVYIGVPPEYADAEKIRFQEADASRLKGKYITLGEVAVQMGWKGVRRV